MYKCSFEFAPNQSNYTEYVELELLADDIYVPFFIIENKVGIPYASSPFIGNDVHEYSIFWLLFSRKAGKGSITCLLILFSQLRICSLLNPL